MKLILTTVTALVICGSAAAQPAHDMSAMDHGAMATDAQGIGVIKKLDAKAGSITLQHAPIPALHWPSMTMAFKIDPAMLEGLKVGQKVDFTVKPGKTPEVIAIKGAD